MSPDIPKRNVYHGGMTSPKLGSHATTTRLPGWLAARPTCSFARCRPPLVSPPLSMVRWVENDDDDDGDDDDDDEGDRPTIMMLKI